MYLLREIKKYVSIQKKKFLVGNTSFRHPAFWYIPKAVPLKAPVILHLKDLSFYTTDRPPEELMSLGAGLSQ